MTTRNIAVVFLNLTLWLLRISDVTMFTVKSTINCHVSFQDTALFQYRNKKIQKQPTLDSRRNFISDNILSGIIPLLIISKEASPASASDSDDLTSQIYNPDGSLKGTMDGTIDKGSEAKSRAVTISFPASSTSKTAISSVDGSAITFSDDANLINATYQVPGKWTEAPNYIDTLLDTREKACDRIIVYQLPEKFGDFNQLEKATTIGVAKALGVGSMEKGILPDTITSADVISGKKVNKAERSPSNDDDGSGTRKYYEFDLAVAPNSCGNSAENLGLGFCPYDTVLLLSATIVEGKMIVLVCQANKDEWKRSSADLKRVRNSFFVEFAPV